MENMQLFKYCPWISREINVKDYFNKYNNILDDVFSPKRHNEELDKEEAVRNFFHIPDDIEDSNSRRATPTSLVKKNIYKSNYIHDFNNFADNAEGAQSAKDFPKIDPFDIAKLEKDCSVDLLTVPDELPYKSVDDLGLENKSGRLTNWYAGAYMDGFIPDGASNKLQTLAHQRRELYKRETIKDYTRLRHRLLKYASTVRMITKEDSPLDIPTEESNSSCHREIIFNVRVHRPFHKKCFQRKAINRFPKHSQEMYMLGSQKLSELKEALLCINKSYVHFDMSNDPDITRYSQMTPAEELFPSGFFYINGVFYNDMRHSNSKDSSEILLKWASRYPNIGKLQAKSMCDAVLNDLNLRLGYPYVYQHLGNCEHLIVFTDVRLLTRMDIQDPSRYPLSRGNPVKLSVKCSACNLYLACWILKDDPRFPNTYTHLCQKCLETFCYDQEGRKKENFKLYPFIDEFFYQQNKERKESQQDKPTFEIRIHQNEILKC